MSCSLVLIWYFTYYCTIHSSAEFFIATAFLTTALISALIEKKGIKIFVCIISLSLIYFYSKDASLLTLLSAIIAGIAGYIYYQSSYQFSKQTSINALSILSIRFYFVLIFAIIYILMSGTVMHLKISVEQAFLFLIFSLVNMVIPAFFSQTCLHSIGVSKFSFLNTLIPTLTFFLEAIFNGVWQTGMLVACLFATLTLNLNHIEKLFKLEKK